MAIARRAFDGIVKQYPQLKPYRATVLAAALLHDLGHGPFSHTAEEIFGLHHEAWTAQILQESPEVRQLLDQFAPGLLDQMLQVYRHQHPVPLVWQLISSQLDCDRLDYLMRDSYFTGATYGQLDLDRILMALRYDPVSQQLVVAQKGLAAIEHYLIVRHFMYAQVYNHPKNIAATWGLAQALARSQHLFHLGQLEADATLTAWLQVPKKPLTLAEYLAADDIVLTYHLQRWQHHTDPVLSDLCRRFLDRDLFKVWNVTHLATTQQTTLLEQVHSWLAELGLAPAHYAGLRRASRRGYTLYQQGIKVQTGEGLQELSTLSPMVQTLISPHQNTWLIYPRQVADKLAPLISRRQV